MTMTHTTYRSNILRVARLATSQEIHDALSFYPGAHGLCRVLAHLGRIPVSHAAGIYAALSPMNDWYTNVANAFDVVRHGSAARVNTSNANKRKAIRIRYGEDPSVVLLGPKVRAFWQAISKPHDTRSIPVDRHLVRAATGEHYDTYELRRKLTSTLYGAILSAYYEVAYKCAIPPNRLASIVWFVQRRLDRYQLCV